MIFFFKFPLEDSLGGAEFHTLKLAKHFTGSKLFTSDRKLKNLFDQNNLPGKFFWVGWEPTSKWSLLLWPLTFFIARARFKKLLEKIPNGSTLFFQSLTEKLVLTPMIYGGKGDKEIKVVWIEHKIPGRWLKSNPLLSQYLKLSKQVQLTTVSNFAKSKFVELGVPESNIKVIYPGVGPTNYSLKPTPSLTIGLLSRLDPEKGVYSFLQNTIPAIKEKGWQVLIAGEGTEKKSIQNLIEKSGLQNQITLLDFVRDLDDFFSQVSVLCYPTKAEESFGIAVLEAMSRGVPAVATNIGALPEIIDHKKTGLLVAPDKPEGWGQYLSLLTLNEFRSELQKNSLARAKDFSAEEMLQRFEKLTN